VLAISLTREFSVANSSFDQNKPGRRDGVNSGAMLSTEAFVWKLPDAPHGWLLAAFTQFLREAPRKASPEHFPRRLE
jgi:hypothetical protein